MSGYFDDEDDFELDESLELGASMGSSAKGKSMASMNFGTDGLEQEDKQVFAVTLFGHTAGDEDEELTIKEGDRIRLINYDEDEPWWKGELNGKVGEFPANHVKIEVQKNAGMKQLLEESTYSALDGDFEEEDDEEEEKAKSKEEEKNRKEAAERKAREDAERKAAEEAERKKKEKE
eukprot:g5992.t1